MANTSKNSKQAAPKKKSLSKNLSDQKENRPKKGKIIKPDPNDSILMSKQLMMKKSIRKTSRPKRKTESTNRILPNGKPMPSLIDLEKMFEDSDDDVEDHKSTDAKYQQALKCSAQTSFNTTERLIIPEVIVTDLLLSPSTRNRIEKQVKEILNKSSSNCHDYLERTSPPRKRLKFHVPSDESDDLPPVNIAHEKKKITNGDQFLSVNNQNISCQNITKPSIIPIELQEKVEELILDDGNVSDNSLDSNKTIEYNLATHKLHSESMSQAFCPLPSTSKDDKTFSKNDELFLESLKEINNNLIKEKPLKQQMAETHAPTIVIDDEIIEEPSLDIKTEIDNNIQIIDSTNQITSTISTDTIDKQNYCEDDDCIIIETCTNTPKMMPKEPDIIDLEYNFIKTESEFNSNNTTEHVDDEIIDVDAIIAQNQLILNKYKNTDSKTLDGTKLVVDVDISTVAENTNNPSAHATNKNQPRFNETLKEITISTNVQDQANNKHESTLGHISDIRTDNSRNHLNAHSQPSPECQIVDVSCNTNVSLGTRPTNSYPNPLNIPQNQNRHLFTQHDIHDFFAQYLHNPLGLPCAYPPSILNDPLAGVFRNMPLLPSALILNDSLRGTCRTQKPTSTSHKKQRAPKKKISTPKKNISKEYPATPIDDGDSGEPHSKPSGSLGDCPICMEKLSGNVIASTICGHVFCMSCLEKAIKANKRCPTCRKLLKNNGYHKIFL